MAHSSSRPQALPPLRNLLVVGGGGREQALAWALRRCPGVKAVWVTPGNGGTVDLDDCKSLGIGEQDAEGLVKACLEQAIDLVVIGPEAPLAAGVADRLRDAGLAVFGPSADGAQLELLARLVMREIQHDGFGAIVEKSQLLLLLKLKPRQQSG